MASLKSQKMKEYRAHVRGVGWVRVWARNLDEADECAGLEYGAANVGRVKPA